MDYPFESLSPEKFQHFCQALLTKERPGVQCFPVAQPDGGRDATQIYLDPSRGNEFAMYQVKFVRNPHVITEPHKWLIGIIEDEIPKVKNQLRRGAKAYFLMTNVAGTAHPEAGSIDIVNSILSETLGLPAVCLWRNDLSRRLDGLWDLKWTYPELMTGPDLIRFVLQNNLSESKERRASAIRAFVTNQFTTDQFVKFKQVDLDNRLLDLFIDVPLDPRFGRGLLWRRGSKTSYEADQISHWQYAYEAEGDEETSLPNLRFGRGPSTGAASFLLNHTSSERFPFTVIEGAPGQGKSTIAQYLCQVHRMRLLEKASEVALTPAEHQSSPIRLPLKVDLRDFASWLARRNPFTAEAEEIPIPSSERSLEGFLAALIRYHSGGALFDVSDLHAVIHLSAVLLVLDGLDEVADIKRREEVVAEIVKGSERLQSNAASLQVVVTSRPAAFENSPGLPDDKFQYFSLVSVTQELIEEYAGKWLKARRLEDRESSEVKKILKEKLRQPHLRDLARNPMQLAILLSLIHTRGVSLPDKRTALYDNYVELFFNRESEKSPIVREHRELLIDIHRYLAWMLHVESEQNNDPRGHQLPGAIEESRLKVVLRDYLTSEGRDPELSGVLFTGLIERVVALVSRVQGTYEFEVQPLREYFAARFLHETAPYSPVGSERRGTRPDRFDAISRNFYWLNVTRFYAGCYSKGELASLIDRLSELIRDSDLRHLSYPRILGATLLGDWVFTQHPKSVTQVIRLILDGLGLRFLLTSSSRRQAHTPPFNLPVSCGKSELIEKCFSMLRAIPPIDYALDVLDLLAANSTYEEICPLWVKEVSSATDTHRTTWLEYGLHLGCLPQLEAQMLEDIIGAEVLTPSLIEVLLNSRRAKFLEATPERFKTSLDAILSLQVSVTRGLRNPSILETVAKALDVSRFALAFREASRASIAELLQRYLRRGEPLLTPAAFDSLSSPLFRACQDLVDAAIEGEHTEALSWATSLVPWENLLSKLTSHFGECWAARQFANVSSAIKSASVTCTDCSDLFDSTKSLCRRARYARLRAGTPTWWNKQFIDASSIEQKMFCCHLYFTWASPHTISQTLELGNEMVASLSVEEWSLLFNLVEQAVELTRTSSRERLVEFPECTNAFSALSPRTLALLRLRARPVSAKLIYEALIPKTVTADKSVLRIFQQDAIRQLTRTNDHEDHLEILAAGFRLGVLSAPFAPQQYSRQDLLGSIPAELAVTIVEDAERYPSFLVAAAESRCRAEVAKRIRPVGRVAEDEGWFKPR